MVRAPESEADTPSRRTRSLSIPELSSVFAQVAPGCPDRCWNLAQCPRQIAGKKSWTAFAVSHLATSYWCPPTANDRCVWETLRVSLSGSDRSSRPHWRTSPMQSGAPAVGGGGYRVRQP